MIRPRINAYSFKIDGRQFARKFSLPPKTPSTKHPSPFALFGLFGLGFLVFYGIVNTRKKEPKPSMSLQDSLPTTSKPTFNKDQVIVIFVLGGPGAGKGTQCAKLVREKGFVHLSAGDLLRAEQNRRNSNYGELISKHIREGTIVPMEVTIALLENAMKEHIAGGANRFLIDGFPRKMDQCLKFEEDVCGSQFTLFFDCDEATMLSRLLNRGKTSGREDDNVESIKKRFRTFVQTTMPVVEYMESKGKILKVDCLDTPENVFKAVKAKIEVALGV